MNWTKEIPTVDGWYWMKDKYGVWIDKLKKGAAYNDVFECWDDPYTKEDGIEFYGPLEEPE